MIATLVDLGKWTIDLAPIAHNHSFTYSASGATITATCGNTTGCPLASSNYQATLTIAAPTMTTYGGTGSAEATITDANSIRGTATIQYQTKSAGTYGTATTTAPTGAGDHKASITVGGATASVEYTIAKADPTAPTGLTATYGQTLANVTLPDGWTWVDSTQSVGGLGSKTFKANFAGNDNYNSKSNVDVTVTVSKADPTAPTGLTATYGQTLANVTLPTGWTWADSTTSVGNVVDPAATFKANFAGDDNRNAASNVDVTVTVGKADPTAPTGLTATYGQTLEDVTLPTGWTWADSTTSVGNVVDPAATFKANFAGDDNRNAASNVDVTVTVGKADPTAPTGLTATYGQTLANVTLPDGWTWEGSAQSAGNVVDPAATFKANFAGNDNYNAASDVDVAVTVGKANAVAATVTANNRTYDGAEKPLVTVAGETIGGEMQYALGTETEATEQYTTSIPTAADVGTYYVWYKVVGDENHNDTEAVCVTVTIQRRSSVVVGGGSVTTTATVPVTSDTTSGSVPVKASVSGTTATVTKLTDAQLAQVTENAAGTETETNSVIIDVSGVAEDVKTAVLPTETIKAVEETGGNLQVTLSDGSVEFDATAETAITGAAKGSDIRINLDAVPESSLNTAQQSAVDEMDVQIVVDAYITSNGERISDFKGGSATLSIPYTLKDGQTANGIVVWFVADDGTVTQVPARYDGKNIVFTVTHFSNYVVAYDEEPAKACPKDSTCPISAFADAKVKAWYHDGVHWALENGVMNGVSSGKFAPNDVTTRAQVAMMLWRLEGSPAVDYEMNYSDVRNNWFAACVRWASSVGIVNGFKDGSFRPNDAVTREQLVTMLYRYAQYKKMDVSVGEDTNILSYDDAFDVHKWAMSAMQWACGSGIVNGVNKDGTLMLAPLDASSRAVVATMLWRFCK